MQIPVPKRGGRRLNAGRKSEVNEKLTKVAVTLSDLALRQLRVIGDGNVSRGVRLAAEVAYANYQNSGGV